MKRDQELLQVRGWKERARALKDEVHALYFAYRDPRVRWPAKVVLACTVAYALSPIDLIPDFIPLLGYLDDLLIVPLGIALSIRLVPSDVIQECRDKAKTTEHSQRIGRYGALAVALVWLVVIAVLLVRVFH